MTDEEQLRLFDTAPFRLVVEDEIDEDFCERVGLPYIRVVVHEQGGPQ